MSKCYILSEFRLHKVTAGVDGDLLATDINVAPIQLPGSTFIKNMIITINGREVFNANQLYSYKSYLDTELSYPKHVKESFLSCAGYAADGWDQDAIDDNGFKARNKMFLANKNVQFITNIDADLFAQDLYLINNCELDIEISPQPDEFMLIQPATNNNTYRLELVNIKLYVKMIELMDGLSLDLARRLEIKPARYSMRKSMLKSLFISEGRFEYNANIFTDEVPLRIIIGLLDTDFNFKNFNVRNISIVANGRNYPQTV